MSLLFETICIVNRRALNLDLHHERMNRSRRELFGIHQPLNLSEIISIPAALTDAMHKCKVVYAKEIEDISFTPYSPRSIKTLAIVDGTGIDYRYKWTDRRALDNLVLQTPADDVIILQKDWITDASFANLIFFDGKNWITPDTPLLRGTRRTRLLQAGRIQEKKLTLSDLRYMQSVKLINAMLDFPDTPEIPAENILWP